MSVVPGGLHHPVVPSYLLEVHPQRVAAALSLPRVAVNLGAAARALARLAHAQYDVDAVLVAVGDGDGLGVHAGAGRARDAQPVVGAGASQPASH